VRGVLRRLLEMIAEIFRPLPRHAYPPLFYSSFIVGSVPEVSESRACLRVQFGLRRFFDGLPTPLRPYPRPGVEAFSEAG
jgi:hypothetical protein